MPIVKASSQNWKDKNSNYKVKVSEATVAKLRKGTKAGNIAAANKPGASAEYREAVSRFYGKGVLKPTGNKFPPNKYPNPSGPSKVPSVDRSRAKPTPKEIADGKKKKQEYNKSKLTPNNREDRRTVPKSPKPMPGPGGRKPAPPRGGPGVKPRPSKGQTPNQRENRKSVPSVRPGGGPGSKPRPARPSGGPGSKPRPSKGQTPNQRESRRSVPKTKMSGGPGSKPRSRTYRMNAGG